MKRPTMKATLGQASLRVYMTIWHMTPAQKRRALRALDGLTERNCAWQLFAMRDILRVFIGMSSPVPKHKPKETL